MIILQSQDCSYPHSAIAPRRVLLAAPTSQIHLHSTVYLMSAWLCSACIAYISSHTNPVLLKNPRVLIMSIQHDVDVWFVPEHSPALSFPPIRCYFNTSHRFVKAAGFLGKCQQKQRRFDWKRKYRRAEMQDFHQAEGEEIHFRMKPRKYLESGGSEGGNYFNWGAKINKQQL